MVKPGPSYSPITKAPSPNAPNNTPIVSFHQAHPNSPHDQSPRPTFTPSITNMCCSNMRYGHHSQKHQKKNLGDVEKNILCEMLFPPFRIWFYGPQVPVLHAYKFYGKCIIHKCGTKAACTDFLFWDHGMFRVQRLFLSWKKSIF